MKCKISKMLSLVLVLVLAFSIMLTGCGNEEKDTMNKPNNEANNEDNKDGADEGKSKFAGQTLEFYMFQGGYGKAWEEALIKKFEAAYDVEVKLNASPKIGDILRPKMIAGKVPDLILLNWSDTSGVTEAMYKENNFYDLTELFNSDELKDRMLPGFLESTLCSPYGDGKVYLAPLFYSGMGLVYNSAYFAENNLETAGTWDEFYELGDTLKDKGRALLTYQGIYPGYLESVIWPAIASGAGLEAFQSMCRYEEGSFSTPEVKQVLQNLRDVVTKGHLLEGTIALNHTDSQTAVMVGKAAFIPDGAWVVNEMKDAPREDVFEWAVTAPPTLSEGTTQYGWAGVENVWIPKNAKNPELAAEFIKFMYSDESVQLGAELAGALLPVKNGLKIAGDKLDPSIAGFYRMFDNGIIPLLDRFDPLPNGSKVNFSSEFFDKNITKLITGEITVDDVVEDMEKICAQVREDMEKE